MVNAAVPYHISEHNTKFWRLAWIWAMQVFLEVLGIWECVWNAEAVELRICNWASTILRICDKFETESTVQEVDKRRSGSGGDYICSHGQAETLSHSVLVQQAAAGQVYAGISKLLIGNIFCQGYYTQWLKMILITELSFFNGFKGRQMGINSSWTWFIGRLRQHSILVVQKTNIE
jgi:hypothetical protein